MEPLIDRTEAVKLARAHDRVAIVGPPRAGKTTLARIIGHRRERLGERKTLHTDDLIVHGWEEQRPQIVAWAALDPGSWLIEGVAMARVLRHAELVPDLVLYLPRALDPVNARAMALGRSVDRWVEMADAVVGAPRIIAVEMRADTIAQAEAIGRGEATTALCPGCWATVADLDGFGPIAHLRELGGCGWCRHASRSGGLGKRGEKASHRWTCDTCGHVRDDSAPGGERT